MTDKDTITPIDQNSNDSQAPTPLSSNPWQRTRHLFGYENLPFVLISSQASRQNAQVSFLALLETLLSIGLYWWVAISWDAHQFLLLSSLFITPLLLLRSKESKALGVQWMDKDYFGFASFKQWPWWHKSMWVALSALLGCLVTYVLLILQKGDMVLVPDSVGYWIWLAVIFGVAAVVGAWAGAAAVAGAGAGLMRMAVSMLVLIVVLALVSVVGVVAMAMAGVGVRGPALITHVVPIPMLVLVLMSVLVVGAKAVAVMGAGPGLMRILVSMLVLALVSTVALALVLVVVPMVVVGTRIAGGVSIPQAVSVLVSVLVLGVMLGVVMGVRAGVVARAAVVLGVGVGVGVGVAIAIGMVLMVEVGAEIVAMPVLSSVTVVSELVVVLVSAGVFLRATLCRVLATVSRLPQGLHQLPVNWWESVVVIDMASGAELIPNIKLSKCWNHFSLHGFWFRLRGKSFFMKVFWVLMGLLFFILALAYRWYIKSTAWAYWFLVVLLLRRPKNKVLD